ncbi:MAG: hypothetical protein ACO3HF_04695 [Burkholderiaceae bacterium]
MAARKSRAAYYKANPESYAKKLAYDKKRNSSSKQKKYRAELAKARRKRGMMGNGGADLSHTKDGKLVREAPSKNRARNGANGKSTKK